MRGIAGLVRPGREGAGVVKGRGGRGGQGEGRQVFGLSLVLLFAPSPGHALPNPTPRSTLGFEPGPENPPEAVMAPRACGA